jgi:cobalt-zinc-cadmium efflux system outer membrane protein
MNVNLLHHKFNRPISATDSRSEQHKTGPITCLIARYKQPTWLTLLAVVTTLTGVDTAAATPGDATSQEVLTVEAAVDLAVANNPGLDDLRRRAEAAAAVPSQVGSLPDPRISVGAGNVPVDTFSLDQEPMTQLQLGVTQVFPYPGKLALRRERAESEAAAATESAEEGRLRLVRDVRSTWWELFYLDRAAGTIAHNIDLLRQLVEIARTKYEVGRGLQQDVLLAQVELSRLQDMAIQIRGMRAASGARMNALLDRPDGSRIVLPASVDALLPRLPPQASLEADAEQSRASIAQAQHEVDAAQSAQALAHKEYLPEFGVSVVYGWRQGNNSDGSPRSDMASAMLNFSVPLFASSKQDQLVAQRRAESAAREKALAETRNRVQAEIATAVANYVQARDEYSLLETGIIPQTEQAVASMLAGYQVSKVDFLTLIRTQVTLYDYELQRWRAQSKAQQALAMLSAAVGRETF